MKTRYTFLLLAALAIPFCAYSSSSSKKISIALNKTVRISLDANKTTGYSWEVTESTPNIAIVDEGYVSPHENKKRTGAGGSQYWVIKGIKKGHAHVRLEYRRPWEKDEEPAQVQEYTITIR